MLASFKTLTGKMEAIDDIVDFKLILRFLPVSMFSFRDIGGRNR
jgi:hypothetical protein